MAGESTLLFQHLPATWLVPGLLILAMAAAFWGWRRYGPAPGGPVTGRIARGARATALALIVLALGGPALRSTWNEDGPTRIVVAVDTSASMAVADVAGAPRAAVLPALAKALAERIPAAQATVTWQAIGGHGPLDPGSLPQPTADGSALADDLDQVVAQTRAERLIVVTDGRVTHGTSLAALGQQWRGRDLPLHLLAVGGTTTVPELAIDGVEFNREAALGEREPLVVRLAHRGLPPGPITVRIEIPGAPPVQKVLMPGTAADPALLATDTAELEVVFPRAGSVTAIITATAGTRTVRESVTANVRERKLTILLLEQRPRYEVRYLREALRRDPTITLHAYLADGRWRRWGGEGPDRLPLAPADLAVYDAILLGDLGPEAFRAADLAALDAAVRRGGAGLLVIPGESGSTASIAGSPAGALLPAELPEAATLSRGYLDGTPRRFHPTPAAPRLGVLESSGQSWDGLPFLIGAGPVTALRPGAEVLAEDQDRRPLIITRAYGAGRTVLVMADDFWRWRRGVADTWLNRIHAPLLRFAAAGHRADRRAWRLGVNPRRAAAGEPVTLDLAPSDEDQPLPERAVLRLTRPGAAEILVPLVKDGGAFRARVPAPTTGTWAVTVAAGLESDAAAPADLVVTPPQAERRDLRADREALVALATATTGHLADSVADLLANLPPDLRRTTLRERTESLWDGWWFLLAATLLFGLDWALRRWNRMP